MLVYLGIGSNIDPAANVRRAVAALGALGRITGISTVYRTAPIGRPEQDAYYNTVVAIDTPLDADVLALALKQIEADLGRQRTQDKYAPRTIDLDILLAGPVVDPDLYTRSFLARGLEELAPDLILPDTHRPIQQVSAGLPHQTLEPLHAYTTELRTDFL